MKNDLKDAFHRYAGRVRKVLRNRTQHLSDGKTTFIDPNSTTALRALVEELEKGKVFGHLVEKTSYLLRGDAYGNLGWRQAVEHFFRRSGYYIDVFDGNAVDDDSAFQRYRSSFAKPKITVNYLLPLEYVHLDRDFIDFGPFRIQRFGVDKLREFFSTRVNEVFYPWAVIDADKMENYWFLCADDTSDAPRFGVLDLDFSGRVAHEYSQYPPVVQLALQQLALYDWEARYELWEEPPPNDIRACWFGFRVPIMLAVHENLLDCPRGAPNLSKLQTEPIPHPHTGEQIGERPEIWFDLNEDETGKFIEFMKRTSEVLSSLQVKESDWNFLDIALGFFIKAYFADGLEELLWHITTVEALLGQREDEGVRGPLARRITSVLADTKKQKETLKKQFNELYDFRCALVHGQVFQKDIYVGHLRNARSIARRTLLWFVHYLAHIKRVTEGDGSIESLPSRKQILMLLDLDEDDRRRLSRLTGGLPDGFPYVHEWLE